MSAEKPNLPEGIREVLTRKGALKPARIQGPETPKVDHLIAWAAKRGFGVTVVRPVPDAEAEPEDQAAHAVVTNGDDAWEWFDSSAAVAVATALANALQATEPIQASFPTEEAAD